MSDFFSRLAGRVRGEATLARPRLPSVYEGPAWPELETVSEVASEPMPREPARPAERDPRSRSETAAPPPAPAEPRPSPAPGLRRVAPLADPFPPAVEPVERDSAVQEAPGPRETRAPAPLNERRPRVPDPEEPLEPPGRRLDPPPAGPATVSAPPSPASSVEPSLPAAETLAQSSPPETREVDRVVAPESPEREPTLPPSADRRGEPGSRVVEVSAVGASRGPTDPPARAAEPAAETTVRVTIGSIVVRAAAEPSKPKPQSQRQAAPRRLEDYLERRDGRGR